MSTSLDSIHITPRTPRTARDMRHDQQNGIPLSGAGVDVDSDEVEMRLLETPAAGFEDAAEGEKSEGARTRISSEDRRAMVLLCVLYLIQGVPLGLALGSIPFLLREHLSYSQLAVFALSNYPYSLKLLWSPIVDSLFVPSVGRRKSWIIPMQTVVGAMMLWMSFGAEDLIASSADHVYWLTFVYTTMVLLSATQGASYRRWALTLLSQENLSYASTCQTIGLNSGYFASFTVFLALNSEAFSSKWGIPRLSLDTYLRFWSVACFSVTIWLTFFQKERKEQLNDDELSVRTVYMQIWSIIKLKHVQSILFMYVFAKVGFAANDAAFSLKLVEHGLGKEDLAIAVLIDFPFQIFGGWIAARYSTGDKPLRPWLFAFWPRLGFCLIGMAVLHWFPTPPISMAFFVYLIVHTVLMSFTQTIQFVGISAFHTRISDPVIGGTYMTLLNTFTNLGGTWPKYFILKGIDYFTVAHCAAPASDAGATSLTQSATECVSDAGKAACKALGGTCATERDGYYIVNALCMAFAVVFLVTYIAPTARRLQALPTSKWRVMSS
ncbi:MFS general substrate transporter [Vararia minispora EC-137]|uniref:MFS general substrate transporter n=1 Tax=Vararia minispora EC-137 TaxID=1314806 RepID=A0ACB8QEM5_9AGAM|nr:MFS general substrate transporter [Vararia minispora EC-137]